MVSGLCGANARQPIAPGYGRGHGICGAGRAITSDSRMGACEIDTSPQSLGTFPGCAGAVTVRRRRATSRPTNMSFARDVVDRAIFVDGGVIVGQGDAKATALHPVAAKLNLLRLARSSVANVYRTNE